MARRACIGGAAALAVLALLVAAAVPAASPRAHAQTGCTSAIDLVFVVDGSESISAAEFDLMRSFIGDVATSFTISPDDAHAGLVQFAGEGQGRIETGLSGDAATVDAAIAGMAQIIGATDIQEGLALGQGELSTSGREGVPHVLVLITDGEHNQPGDPYAEAGIARGLGTEIFAVGIGDEPQPEQLAAIAGDAANVFAVGDFDGLVGIISPLVTVVCPPTPTFEPIDSSTVAPPEPTATPVDDVLGVSELPNVGNGLPPDLEKRGGHLAAQALGGLGGAVLILAATYWMARRRARR